MSSPTRWVPGRGISVSLHGDTRPERDTVPKPQINVRAVAEIGGEIFAQRQVTIEIFPEIVRVEPQRRPPLVQPQLQAVVVRQVDLRDLLREFRPVLLQPGDQPDAALQLRARPRGVAVVETGADRPGVILRLSAE